MGIFSSLKWFKSEKEKELESLRVKEQELKNEILKKDLEMWDDVPQILDLQPKRVFKTVKLVNNILTVVFHNGDVVSKSDATRNDYERIKNTKNEDEILDILLDPNIRKERKQQQEEVEKVQKTIEGMDILKGLSDFEVEGKSVTLKGTDRTLPPLLVEKFASLVGRYGVRSSEEEEYLALKRFFLWCCLNPRAEVADELYDFLVRNSFRITKQGFFVALRNVVTVDSGDKKLVEFVSNSYNKVKAVWKKKPSNFIVTEDNGEYKLEQSNGGGNHRGLVLGSLEELYLDLPNMKENRYTDAHTRTFDIRVGKVVNMPPEECSWSTADCAHAGLKCVASL